MTPKESGTVRYAYGVAMALLLGGTAFSLATGQAGAQIAQNAPAALAPRPGAPMSFADLTARLQPAVVNISTKQRIPVRAQVDPFEEFFRRFDPNAQPGPGQQAPGQGQGPGQPRTRETGSLGSGFIVSPDGYVVTNNHLVQSASGNGTVDSVTVITSDRKEYPAKIIGRDPSSDLALLKIEGRNLPFVNWGDSTKARVGDWVLAIGNPYGLGGTVTAGIISALHRGITGVGAYDRYIQTDASINMGNSGGPMFDLNGNVIGINSALISPTGASVGIGLAIPAELAKPVIDSLRKGQRPQRGYLGVGLQPIDEDIAPSLGLPKDRGEIVRSIVAGGPADRAGLRQGDVILRVNGKDVTPEETVSYLIANTPVGSRSSLDIIRGGRRQTVSAVVGERPTEEELAKLSGGDADGDQQGSGENPAVAPQRVLGLSLSPLTPELARAANLPPGSQGVIVTGLDAGSDAAEKGVQRGDVILSINQQAVRTPAEFVAAVDAARRAGRSSVLLLVRRNGLERFFGIDISNR
ncbi:MAG TPA: Do family serine endopeptidase [Sphingomicrobium sp.]|nr:Do family serine endopeptidase [Sphingomicrobium sp.]